MDLRFSSTVHLWYYINPYVHFCKGGRKDLCSTIGPLVKTYGNSFNASYVVKKSLQYNNVYMLIFVYHFFDPLCFQCVTPVLSCDGWHIVTVEGLGSKKDSMHPLQERLAAFHGTQCGFCSPGMVMQMNRLIPLKPN